MFYLQEGFTYHLSKFPAGCPRDICLRRVVLAAHYRCGRSVPTPRHFRLDQGTLGHSMDRVSILWRVRIFDLSGKRHGGT